MKILFLGDSITDACRNRDIGSLGSGYPVFVAGALEMAQPGQHTFVNKGISGDRSIDIYSRIQLDAWNLKPDFMSILMGINDVWHTLSHNNGVSAQRFSRIYQMLLEDTLEACPDLQIMLMEPFTLPGSATLDNWDFFREECKQRAQITRELARKFNLPFLPLQDKFDRACQTAPASCWLRDGVHPTSGGHLLIANAWLDAYHAIYKGSV